MKNIPIPNEDDYLRGLIEKIGSLLRRMRNKVKFFDNRDVLRCKNKETYGIMALNLTILHRQIPYLNRSRMI